MRCPTCSATETRVVDTTTDSFRDEIRRRRVCQVCEERFTTVERVRLEMPLVIKEGPDGTPIRREPFDRDKVKRGIRLACAKRPISQQAIERLVDAVATQVRHSGYEEITSGQIGEYVIAGLRDLDEIAYIRYAIIFLGLEDLTAVQREIEQLLQRGDKKPTS